MLELDHIRGYFPPLLRNNPLFAKHMVKEYVQLMVLDFLSASPYIRHLVFIGGTNLRLVKGIDRFSEDLDFDCRELDEARFMEMTDAVVAFLVRSGLRVETRDKRNDRLTAYRRNLHFPQLLFDLHLTGHREERFLLKIEAQDQGVTYSPVTANVRGCGFFFPLPVPPDGVLLSMKLAAMLKRAKGRDFYDAMFLLSRTQPDYDFLRQRAGIGSPEALKQAVRELLARTDMSAKQRDFRHLLFQESKSESLLRFADFIEAAL